MKDIKNYIIGFLSATCMFLFMGQTNSQEGVFDTVVANKIYLSEGADSGIHTVISAGRVTVSNGDSDSFATLSGESIGLFNTDGSPMCRMQNNQKQSAIGIADKNGVVRTLITHDKETNKSSISINNQNGNSGLIMGEQNNQGYFSIYDGGKLSWYTMGIQTGIIDGKGKSTILNSDGINVIDEQSGISTSIKSFGITLSGEQTLLRMKSDIIQLSDKKDNPIIKVVAAEGTNGMVGIYNANYPHPLVLCSSKNEGRVGIIATMDKDGNIGDIMTGDEK